MPFTKVHSTWMIDLIIKWRIIKFLQYIGKYLGDLGFHDEFLALMAKVLWRKEKKKKTLDFIKSKLSALLYIARRMKNHRLGKNICETRICKGFVSSI